jgi:energy-coupling factor transport system permease protein
MTYRRRASPLHAARAAVALIWCAALAGAALLASGPLILGGVVVGLLAACPAAGVGREMARALRLAVPLALTIAVINALVTRNGLTVIWRFGQLPILGQVNVTLEATVYGLVLGLRAAALVLCGALLSVAVAPDEGLRLFRRFSFRSALTASIATRMVPVLVRDSRRLADAQRCRPGPPPGRLALMRAATSGVLDRALDVAAALEVRGYGAARRPPRSPRAPYSRHDVAFLASALAVLAIAVAARVSGLAPFSAYPLLRSPVGLGEGVLALGLVACALAPLADRRGVEP